LSKEIIVGKHTLESLTRGLYSDAKSLYREYVQNSVDSIENAVEQNILKRRQAEIKISLEKSDGNYIKIKDNGTGIKSSKADEFLLDIGNSRKNPEDDIGFRGIGRLAGLGYSKNLKFVTTYFGESQKSIIRFNAAKMRKMLLPGKYKGMDIFDVLNKVVTEEKQKENTDKHYFKVILEEVENIDGIMNFDKVKDYLSQVAPVPFDNKHFTYSEKIKDKAYKMNIPIKEYNLTLRNEERSEKILKNYSNSFISDIRNKKEDHIKKVKIEPIKSNVYKGILWYSVSDYYGTIVDCKKKGLRFRKKNFQIGDRFTLNKIFKEDRFNGWFQGEVYIEGENLIPNSRRDNFEKNKSYKTLISHLEKYGKEMSKEIRRISRRRNDIKKRDNILRKIDYLNGNSNGTEKLNVKLLKFIDDFNGEEKKALDRVFQILIEDLSKKRSEELINKILEEY